MRFWRDGIMATLAVALVAIGASVSGADIPEVVLPESPTAVERSAAEELADGLGKCLGKKPDIVSEGAAREG